MNLSKLKLCNFRCFGPKEQVINVNKLAVLIGNNNVGKTAALVALSKLFADNAADRLLQRSDFHLPKGTRPEDLPRQELYIEADFDFNELDSDNSETNNNAVPLFFREMVVDAEGKCPYLRIRLEANWQNNGTLEGDIESKIYYITCTDEENIPEECKKTASRMELSKIRVIYVPAVRNPVSQLRNVTGSMMYRMMSNIKWSNSTKKEIEQRIVDLNQAFTNEAGVASLSESISSQWQRYDEDERYSHAKLQFSAPDMDTILKRSEIVFSPTVVERDYKIDEMGDGLKSLFYISLVSSLLEMENKLSQETNNQENENDWAVYLPVLTIVAIEEPENHIAPHLLGRVLNNLKTIAKKSNSQTVMTTHSPSIVKRIETEDLRYLRLENSDNATRVQQIHLPDSEKLADQYKFVKEAVRAYPEIYFARLVILGEGDSEELLLPAFFQRFNGNIDINGISIVPLGGRYVNHFWRLLTDLQIPYITLLDLDRERFGGGWGRIKYVLNQLIENGIDQEVLLANDFDPLDKDNLEKLGERDYSEDDLRLLDQWLGFLEQYHVFFSAPLDIDFVMLESYGEYYKQLLSKNEGPVANLKSGGKSRKLRILDIEKGKAQLNRTEKRQYQKRIKLGIQSALKENGGKGDSYTKKQQELMLWYTYFFLGRGKPTTHIEAITRLRDLPRENLIKTLPDVFQRLLADANSLLQEKER